MKKVSKIAEKFFYAWLKKYKNGPYKYDIHVPEVVYWAKTIIKENIDIDSEIALAGAWLHDIGSYPLSKKDHAAVGEVVTKQLYKKNGVNKEVTNRIAHCVRSHRCKDVLPQTREAKLVACADSASHITDYAYMRILAEAKAAKSSNRACYALDKLERDYRDLEAFPEVKKKLTPLYLRWRELIKEYAKTI
jgi:HD superfamily phosphodiesterase